MGLWGILDPTLASSERGVASRTQWVDHGVNAVPPATDMFLFSVAAAAVELSLPSNGGRKKSRKGGRDVGGGGCLFVPGCPDLK